MGKRNWILVFLGLSILINIISLYPQTEDNQKEILKIYEKAQKYEKEGNLEKALEIYQKILETSAELSLKKTVLITIAQIYTKGKRYEEALKILNEYLDLAQTPFEICRGKTEMAYIYIYQGDYSKGFQILDEIKEKYSETEFASDAQFSKAAIYHNIIKEYESAIKEYEKMIEKYPYDWRVKTPFVLEKIASCYYHLKRYDDAIKIYEKIINKYPDTPFEKYARLCIEFINEYDKKGEIAPPEIIMKRMKEIGLGEGIVSFEIKDGKIINIHVK